MLIGSRYFVLIACLGIAITVGGSWIVHLVFPTAKDATLAMILGGFLILAFAIAPLFTRAFLAMAGHAGILSLSPERLGKLADILAIMLWVVWATGAAVALPLVWDDMIASLQET
ncbi:hypothetical protein RCO27_15640 [Sphingosinicella sp. LHD-64]|uniref:hypothetical protein n=1 Tax=Sphingosinicella sp. LHD-64 TaxID=3072139 RepID=UPI00280F04CD|nr:hypothetical protein [Sphingosinicella sp. LHD-64]MDQ8757661.1 hypothetical protein [Sphingosinicella sp. LHD-64]